jgi:hypothetical protein
MRWRGRLTGVIDQFLAYPSTEIRHPTGNNGGLFVEADGFLSDHDSPK